MHIHEYTDRTERPIESHVHMEMQIQNDEGPMGTPVLAPPEPAPPILPPLEARDGDPPAPAAVEEGGASIDIDSPAHAALASEHGRGQWAFRLVRGSVYVTGERVEATARDGRAAIEAAPGLTPGA